MSRRTIRSLPLRLSVAKWRDGRAAALSIRFDDSHPTHLAKAVPILREYGFRGTPSMCRVKDAEGGAILLRPGTSEGMPVLRLDVSPHDATYSIELTP